MMSSVKTKTIRPLPLQNLLPHARELIGRALGFRECEPAALDAMVDAGQLRTLGRGEYAVRRGDRSPSAWFLIQGLVEASLMHSDGQRQLLGLLLPGDVFSLMSVVDDGGTEYDVSAREPSAVLVVPLTVLRELRAQYPCLVRACEKQFVYRARLLHRRLAFDPAVSLDVRTAGMINLLGSLYGTPTANGIELGVRLTQTDMADLLGMSRQRMNFVLKQLESEGLIELHYSSLIIRNPQRLAARAES